MSANLKIAKFSDRAIIPTRGSSLAAGYDLYSAYDYTVLPWGKCLIKTDLQIIFPPGTYGRVAPRSGLALKHSLTIGGGVLDRDFEGNVSIIMFNLSPVPFSIVYGTRVAQFICEKIETPEIEVGDLVQISDRGVHGLGSTGYF